jgi:formylglycine-generating enzyme required for sulfatase activity
MLGNVQEWTSTLWGGELQTCQYPYPYRPDDGREDPEARDHRDKAYRIHRGGSYRSKPATLHAAKRSRAEANSRSRGRGFRVLMEL